jgi:hypothetical protein
LYIQNEVSTINIIPNAIAYSGVADFPKCPERITPPPTPEDFGFGDALP